MKYILLGTLLCSEVFAAGSGGHGHVSDIIPNAVNLTILIVFLVIVLRKKLKAFFTDKAVVISETMERAETKAKEAQMMMEQQKSKIEGAQAEIEKLKSDVDNQIKTFETAYKKEVDERIIGLKEDAGMKIEAEKTAMLAELNSNLLDQVIIKAKSKINSEAGLKNKATDILIGEL